MEEQNLSLANSDRFGCHQAEGPTAHIPELPPLEAGVQPLADKRHRQLRRQHLKGNRRIMAAKGPRKGTNQVQPGIAFFIVSQMVEAV